MKFYYHQQKLLPQNSLPSRRRKSEQPRKDYILFMTNSGIRDSRPFLLLFIFLNAFLLVQKKWVADKGLDRDLLIAGNLILFAASFISFLLLKKGLKAANTITFMKSFYGSFVLKFFLIAIIAFAYIFVNKAHINKPSLYICVGLYVIYTIIEVSSLQRLLRKPNDG